MIQICSSIKPDFDHVEELLQESFASGRLSNSGPCVIQLANRLTLDLGLGGDKRAFPVASGHIALMAAYYSLRVNKLLMPAYTFPSTYTAAALMNLDVKFADVETSTGCISVNTIKDIPEEDYDAVVAVCGLSTIPNLEELQAFCKEKGKKLIIDGAASFGTPHIYQYGDAFCLSLHSTKTLPVGEGGVLIMDPFPMKLAKQFINFGISNAKQLDIIGLNGKMSEYTAAICLDLLDKIDYSIQRRLMNYLYFTKAGAPCRFPNSWKETDTVYQFAPCFMSSKEEAETARMLLDRANIPHLQYYNPIVNTFNTTNELYRRNICLPIHQDVTKSDIDFIVSILKTATSSH